MGFKRLIPAPLQLSVIIVNYNVREFLRTALVSLQKGMKGIRGEIFVVDNASTDGSAEMVSKNFPSIRLIRNKTNVGFAKANNAALERCRGKYVLLINPDTIVQEKTLHVMMRFFEQHPEAGLAGCTIINPDGSFQLACRRGFPTAWVAFTKMTGLSILFPRTRLFGGYNLTYKDPDQTYEVDAVSGSFMMVRREVFREVGGLDEQFFMYGEDLDYCYRVQQAGWKNYYVHSTRIIHYKGESTRRSSIDEIRMFHDAMHLFVKKHFGHSFLMTLILRIGIIVSSWFSMIRQMLRPFVAAAVDATFVVAGLMAAEFVRFGEIFRFPDYAYPVAYIIPSVVIITALALAGVYTHRKMSVSRTTMAVFAGYVVVSALVAFFKEYAFSRIVLVVSGFFTLIALTGWRLALRFLGKRSARGRKSIFGRRTLIIGVNKAARGLARRLKERMADGYEVLGFVDRDGRRVGQRIDGLEVVSSFESAGKVMHRMRITDVIFSTEDISYEDILGVVGGSSKWPVDFHLVPSSLDVMIGKSSVDHLNDLPLVEISPNIERSLNKVLKRGMDIIVSIILLISAYPFVYLKNAFRRSNRSSFVSTLPAVLSGTMSLVGPAETPRPKGSSLNGQSRRIAGHGKPGMTGLVQLQGNRRLTPQEVERLNLYYARNHSILLDLEILWKSMTGVSSPRDSSRNRAVGQSESKRRSQRRMRTKESSNA